MKTGERLALIGTVMVCRSVHRGRACLGHGLVLLALNMPNISAHKILRQAADLEESPPIIVVTELTHGCDIDQAASAGMADCLSAESPATAGIIEMLDQTGREYRQLIRNLPSRVEKVKRQ